ncbi:hypothetical protein ABFY58_24310 [Enterobacter soli]
MSKGIEFELNGALTDNWQLTFGATRFIAEDKNGNAVSSDQPRTTMKLFTVISCRCCQSWPWVAVLTGKTRSGRMLMAVLPVVPVLNKAATRW